MNTWINRALRWYLWVLMAGLLFQGAGSLLFRLNPWLPASTPLLVRGTFGIDFWHAWLHIGWGLVGLAVLWSSRAITGPARLAVIFGLFDTSLGLLGVIVHHPLGLELDLPENLFHLLAGPAALGLGLLALAEPRIDRSYKAV